MKKILFILLIISLLTGCGNNSITKNEKSFQSKIIENNNSYDYSHYKKIQSTAIDFELALLDEHINIENISFENSQYYDGTFKTAIFIISAKINISLKFNDNQELILVNLYCYKNENDNNYNNVKRAVINWKYWDFNNEEIDKINKLYENTINIKNFEIDSSNTGLTITNKNLQ